MASIATCSYGEFKADMGIPVRISLGVPRHPVPEFDPHRGVWELTPRRSYFNASNSEFDRQFIAQLDLVGPERLVEIFDQVAEKAGANGRPLVLLCFERLGAKKHKHDGNQSQIDLEASICHRRVFAKWWLMNTGEEVPEFGSRPGDTPPSHDQSLLF